MDNSEITKILEKTERQKHRLFRALIGSIVLVVVALIMFSYLVSHLSQSKTPVDKIYIEKDIATESIIQQPTTESNVKSLSNKIVSNVADSSDDAILSNESLQQINQDVSSSASGGTQKVQAISSVVKIDNKVTKPIHKITKPVKTEKVTKQAPNTLEDVLDKYEQVNNQPKEKHEYYIQFAAFKDKAKLEDAKQLLLQKQLNPIVQPVETSKGKLYRLRVGPFNNKNIAEERYNKIKDIGITAIITGN